MMYGNIISFIVERRVSIMAKTKSKTSNKWKTTGGAVKPVNIKNVKLVNTPKKKGK